MEELRFNLNLYANDLEWNIENIKLFIKQLKLLSDINFLFWLDLYDNYLQKSDIK